MSSSKESVNHCATRDNWVEILGAEAQDVFEDLEDTASQARATLALDALACALGEDAPLSPMDPGLPEDYEVLEVIGRGASGIVYRALQRSLGREVAVKLLRPGGDAREAERLLGEARRLAVLTHPGIVAVHEVGRTATSVFITLELQAGGSLQSLIADKPLNPALAARLTRQAAEALAYTHSRGVVHLDLKPGNVLLDAEGNARVADFGLAREVAGMEFSATSGGLLGTPAFMAPEQAADRRDQFGERTDVYGLGALLYACLTGAPPFQRASLLSTLQAVKEEEPRKLEQSAPGTPRDLIAIVHLAMSKESKDRYPTALALAQDLARFESGQGVQARLPGRFIRSLRFFRRNGRELAIGVAGSLLALLAVLPFRSSGIDQDEGRLLAAQELLEAGENQAALILLDRVEVGTSFGASNAHRLATLRNQANASPGQKTESDTKAEQAQAARAKKNAAALSLSLEDWNWIDGHLGHEWLRAPTNWFRSPLDEERAWQALLIELGQAYANFESRDQERAAEIASHAPQWNWDDGWRGWLSETPRDSRALLALAPETLSQSRSEPAALPSYWVHVGVYLADDNGGVSRIGSQTKVAGMGERLRIEGQGRSHLRPPTRRIGLDLLHLNPSKLGSSRSGMVCYEVEGEFEAMAGGVMWHVSDLETTFGIAKIGGSWFLDSASDGLLVGQTGLLEAHRYLWGQDQAATLLLLAEVGTGAPPIHEQQERTLVEWRQDLTGTLVAAQDLPFDDSSWMRVPPARRAVLFDTVEALAVLGTEDARDALRELSEGLATAEVNPSALFDDFFERGLFTGTTTAGADFGTWLNWAKNQESESATSIAAILPKLPRPPSADSDHHGSNKKVWLFTAYIPGALLFLIVSLRKPRNSLMRSSGAAAALLLAAQALDKSTPLVLGGFLWDPIALPVMALAAFLLIPRGGQWARIAGIALLFASLQALFEPLVPLPETRAPLAVALVALAFVTARIDSSKKLAWLPFSATLLFGSATLVAATPIGSPEFVRWVFGFTFSGALIVLLCLLVVCSRVRLIQK